MYEGGERRTDEMSDGGMRRRKEGEGEMRRKSKMKEERGGERR